MIIHVTHKNNLEAQQQGNSFGGGFPGGFGINIEDLLRQQMGGQRGGGGRQQFTFTFGGGHPGQGMHFEF
jgi:hypothetical protein